MYTWTLVVAEVHEQPLQITCFAGQRWQLAVAALHSDADAPSSTLFSQGPVPDTPFKEGRSRIPALEGNSSLSSLTFHSMAEAATPTEGTRTKLQLGFIATIETLYSPTLSTLEPFGSSQLNRALAPSWPCLPC